MARKILTREQAETAKARAASFLRNVVKDDDRADEVEGEDLETWATETGRTITNPGRQDGMADTKADLQDTLDQIADLVSDALDPVLTREDVVAKLQEIDSLLSGDDDDSDDDDSDDDNGDESD